MAPQWVDENPNIDGVEEGLNVAENEKRELAEQQVQQAARRSDEPEEALDDAAFSASENAPVSPTDLGGLAPDEVVKPQSLDS